MPVGVAERGIPPFSSYSPRATSLIKGPFGTETRSETTFPLRLSAVLAYERVPVPRAPVSGLLEDALSYGAAYVPQLTPLPDRSRVCPSRHAVTLGPGWQPIFDIPLGNGVFANDSSFPRGAVGFSAEA